MQGYLVQLLSVPLVDEVSPGEQVSLEVPVQHVLHHCVHRLVPRADAQQSHDVTVLEPLHHVGLREEVYLEQQ